MILFPPERPFNMFKWIPVFYIGAVASFRILVIFRIRAYYNAKRTLCTPLEHAVGIRWEIVII